MNIYPYKNGSQGAKELAAALGVKQIKREGSKFKGSEDKLVINWGSSTMSEEASKCKVLNNPEAVALASNKLSFFNRIAEWNDNAAFAGDLISIPHHVTDHRSALEYYDDGFSLVCRTILNGHSGQGIVLIDPAVNNRHEIPDCQLYVVYQPKKSEYRVHVLGDKVVDIQKKCRRIETPDDQVNWKIRNHDNGFIYARNDVAENTPKAVLKNSLNAIRACGLDFGAVDVIYNERQALPYVLEINTAPGLTGETLDGYTKRFAELEEAFKAVKKNPKINMFQAGLGRWVEPIYAVNPDPVVVNWPRRGNGNIDYDLARAMIAENPLINFRG